MRRRGGTDAVIAETLAKLRRLNYISDQTFARDWALSRAQNQGYGPRKIEQELKTKGVNDAVIRATVREIFEQESQEQRARKVLQKRFKNENFQEPRALSRAVAFLQRRGYSSQVIFALLGCSIDDNC